MLMVGTVGICGGGRVVVIGGGGKGERNRRQQDDHRWDIVLVIVMKIAYITCPPLLSPLAWSSHP